MYDFRTERSFGLFQRVIEIRFLVIYLVDNENQRFVESFRVTCDDLGSYLDTSNGIDYQYTRVDHVQRRDNSSDKIVCTRGVYEIELVLFPLRV